MTRKYWYWQSIFSTCEIPNLRNIFPRGGHYCFYIGIVFSEWCTGLVLGKNSNQSDNYEGSLCCHRHNFYWEEFFAVWRISFRKNTRIMFVSDFFLIFLSCSFNKLLLQKEELEQKHLHLLQVWYFSYPRLLSS